MASRVYNGWIYEQDASGDWVRSRPASGPAPNPTYPLEAPKMQADIGNTTAGTRRTVVQTQGDILDNQTKAKDLRQNPLSDRDAAFINGLRNDAKGLPGYLQNVQAARAAVDRFQPSPGRGTLYSMGTPDDNDGMIVSALKSGFGYLLPDQMQEDYQTLLGVQNKAILNEQQAQSGPQTESDAARMARAGLSPNKDVIPNKKILDEQEYNTRMGIEKPSFYTYWANQLGSTQALNSKGQSADQVWNQEYQRGLQRMRRDPSYQGRTSVRGAPRKQNRVIDWNDY